MGWRDRLRWWQRKFEWWGIQVRRFLIYMWQKGREQLNQFLVDTEGSLLPVMSWVVGAFAVATAILLAVYYGFRLSEAEKELIVSLLRLFVVIFVVNYLLRLLYARGRRVEFLLRSWVEGILVLIAMVDFVGIVVRGEGFFMSAFKAVAGERNYYVYYVTAIQLYMVALMLAELVRFSVWLIAKNVNPTVLLLSTFALLIAVGTALLSMPLMSHRGLTFVEALFTATSAACVTGLTVVNTALDLTFRGQLVVLVLIQLGGIAIVSAASLFAVFLRRGLATAHSISLMEHLAYSSVDEVRRLLVRVLIFTFVFELLGAVLIYLSWGEIGKEWTVGERIFHSVFHAVSAFCNAGFSTLPQGLEHPLIHTHLHLPVIVAMLVVFGGLGFPALEDLFSVRRLRMRLRQPWRRWRTSTRVAVYVSAVLVVLGTVVIFMLENWRGSLGSNPVEGIVVAFFESVATRTAGFSIVDISRFDDATLFFMMMLMIIGASSGSTGGGIKTSTFLVVLTTAIAVARRQREVVIFKRTVSQELQNRALAVLAFSLMVIALSVFVLSVVENGKPFISLMFEAVSAFGTVGLSTGITPHLTIVGKLVLIFEMFVGRVGPLAIVLLLSMPASRSLYRYPYTNIMIG